MHKILLYIALLIFTVGCQPEALTQPTPLPTIDVGLTVPALPTQESKKDDAQMTQPAPSSGLESLIERAEEDLAQRLSMDVSQISLVEAKEVVWPDASLGCPQEGMMYAQVETKGYIILVEVDKEKYEYHTNTDNTLMLCETIMGENSSKGNSDKNVEDGWPNQTKDKEIIIATITPRK